MPAFKKSGGFRGGERKEGFERGGDRPRFARKGFSHGGSSRDRDVRPQMFAATCAKCHKACEVPFRPNGERPVFCKDCFGARPSGNDYGRKDAPGRDFPKREFAPSTPKSTVEDTRIDELKRTMEAMNKKLDAIERMIGSLSPTSTTEIKKTEPTLGKVLKSVAKKAGKTKK